jgi:hypothetical protein
MNFEGADRIRVIRSGEDDRRRRLQLLQVLGELDAIHLGHPDVQEDHVGRILREHVERGAARRSLAHHLELNIRAAVGEQIAQARARWGLVVDDHDAQKSFAHAALAFT